MPILKKIIVVFATILLLTACSTETPTPETITVQETVEVPVTVQTMQEAEVTRVVEIVRLDDRGFLLATDQFPQTLLPFWRYRKKNKV